MKIVSLALLLMACAAFVLVGCSDNPAVPVSPAEPTAQAPPALAKAIITNFTFTHHPIAPPSAGEKRHVGEVWIMKDITVQEQVFSDDPLVAGTMVNCLSGTLNATSGEGPVHGKFILTPTGPVGGGVWEATYTGYRSKSEGVYFTIPLKVVVQGRGGTLQGMQGFFESVITSWGIPTAGWIGAGEGFYKSH